MNPTDTTVVRVAGWLVAQKIDVVLSREDVSRK